MEGLGRALPTRRRARAGEHAGMTTIMLVDDQELLRMGFRMVLDSQPDLEVVAEAGDGREAIALAARHEPDIVLMDVRMPDVDGVVATREIIASGGASRIIILTTF